jgi:SAM-dependent methyltransferase
MPSSQYNQRFFDYVNAGAERSARKLLPLLARLDVRSVLDVGSGQGAWLSVWKQLGVDDVVGLDGDYVDRGRLKIPAGQFVAADLGTKFDLGRRFDLVQCLEVAEHLPKASAGDLVSSLTRHSDIVLFSAAVKGQGGEDHINEQSYDYWRELFAAHDFVVLDFIRPIILHEQSVEPWYKYNSFVYVRRSRLDFLPSEMRETVVSGDQPLKDLSPATFRIRKALVRLLPVAAVSLISRLRIAILMNRSRRNL